MMIFLLVTLVVGGYFFVSSKITPSNIKAEIEQHLSKIFPQGEITVGNVTYSLGPSVFIGLEKLEGNFQNDPLFRLENIDISIPIFSILKGEGTISVSLNRPFFHYKEMGRETNWSKALGKQVNAPQKRELEKQEGGGGDIRKSFLTLPLFIRNSTLNVDLMEIDIVHSSKNKKNEIKVDKLLLKELGINSFLSFELDSFFNIALSDGKSLGFKLVSIGEMKLQEFFENSLLPASVIVKASEIKTEGLPYQISDIQSKIDFSVDPSGNIQGTSEIGYRDSSTLNFKFRIEKDETTIEDLTSSLSIKNVLEIVHADTRDIATNDPSLAIEGEVSFRGNKIDPNLKIDVLPTLHYDWGIIKTVNEISAEFRGDKAAIATKTNILGGVITSQTQAVIDVNSLERGIRRLKSNVNVNNVNMEEKLIRSFLSSAKGKENAPSKKENAKEKKESSPRDFLFPQGELNVTLNDNSIGTSKIGGVVNIRSRKKNIRMRKSQIKIDRGSLALGGNIRKQPKGFGVRFTGDLKNINVSSLRAFLPKSIGTVKGLFSGSVSGTTQYREEIQRYDVSVDISGENGSLEKMDISSSLEDLLAALPLNMGEKLKGKKIKIDPDFRSFRLNARLRESQYLFREFHFFGLKDKVEIKGNGDIYPTGGKRGEVFLSYRDGTGKLEELIRQTGESTLPLKFSGVGLHLKPDYQYTIQKLGKSYIKNKGKEKVKEMAKENIKKIFKGKNIKGLLDGLL